MWIGLNDGWLSVVESLNDKGALLVRARKLSHLTNAFPDCDHFKDPHADYPFRAYIPRSIVADVIGDRIIAIDYPNFKGSVREGKLLSAYHSIWGALLDAFRSER